MAAGRAVFIDGPTGSGRTRLAQELALQCAAQGLTAQWWPQTRPGHPLLRPYAPATYPSLDSFGAVLEVQWQNFATRAATEGGLHFFDGALLQAGFRTLLAAGAAPAAIAVVIERLLTGLAPLDPTLIYLSSQQVPADAPADWPAWRSCCDTVFGHLALHRLLLNADRASPAERLHDALEFLALPGRGLPAAAAELAGRYAADATPIIIRSNPLAAGTLEIEAPGLPGSPRALLAAADGSLLVAGLDLRLAPQAQAGRITGLLLESGDPRLEGWPQWLPRTDP